MVSKLLAHPALPLVNRLLSWCALSFFVIQASLGRLLADKMDAGTRNMIASSRAHMLGLGVLAPLGPQVVSIQHVAVSPSLIRAFFGL